MIWEEVEIDLVAQRHLGAIIIYSVSQSSFRSERETKIRIGRIALRNKEGDESVWLGALFGVNWMKYCTFL